MSDTRFLANFILLSLVSGLTIGLGKIVTTLYALSLGASAFQIGLISAMESIGMVLVTVPAGFIIARCGMRSVYFTSSLGPMLVNIGMAISGSVLSLASGRFAIGLCIPFRVVSMNSAFLERLPRLGQRKAGWYRGTLTAGMAIIGPAAAIFLTRRLSVFACFLLVSMLFAIMAAFSLSFMPERQAETAGRTGLMAEMRLMIADVDIAESCLIELLGAATVGLFATFIIVLAASLPGLTERSGMGVLLFQGVTSVVLLFAGGAIAQRLGRHRAYAAGLSLATAALLTFGFASGFAGLALGAALLSAGAAIVHLVNMAMLAALPGGKSKVAGLYNLASMAGASFGALAGGVLARAVPLQAVFLLWLPVLALGAGGIALLRHRRPAAPLGLEPN